jgi:PadR family transcriptional regulator, regulatory protein PadR
MANTRHEVLPGTLNLLILKKLAMLGPLHGYGIAPRIEQVSGDLLELNQGTIYPALLKLEQLGWIRTKWSVSENNRRAKYYSLTAAGKKQLLREEEEWRRTSAIVSRSSLPRRISHEQITNLVVETARPVSETKTRTGAGG